MGDIFPFLHSAEFFRPLKPTTTEISAPLLGRDRDDRLDQADHSDTNLGGAIT